MTLNTEAVAPTDTVVADRRRPGRIEQVNPALIPVLRTSELPPDLGDTIEFDEPDQMAGARGIFAGVAISAPFWVGIVCLGRWLFR